MDQRVKLSVLGFSFNQERSATYGLVLGEENGARRLVVVIGAYEAQAIAFKLQKTDPPRPLTHDLFYSLFLQFGISLLEVEIYKYEDGVFYAKLVLKQGPDIIKLESRTSDAINIALRTKSPIYTTPFIMDNLSVVFDESTVDNTIVSHEDTSYNTDYTSMSQEQLEELLKEAIEIEDYELASLIRDELAKKKE